jgi:hypothetical protein
MNILEEIIKLFKLKLIMKSDYIVNNMFLKLLLELQSKKNLVKYLPSYIVICIGKHEKYELIDILRQNLDIIKTLPLDIFIMALEYEKYELIEVLLNNNFIINNREFISSLDTCCFQIIKIFLKIKYVMCENMINSIYKRIIREMLKRGIGNNIFNGSENDDFYFIKYIIKNYECPKDIIKECILCNKDEIINFLIDSRHVEILNVAILNKSFEIVENILKKQLPIDTGVYIDQMSNKNVMLFLKYGYSNIFHNMEVVSKILLKQNLKLIKILIMNDINYLDYLINLLYYINFDIVSLIDEFKYDITKISINMFNTFIIQKKYSLVNYMLFNNYGIDKCTIESFEICLSHIEFLGSDNNMIKILIKHGYKYPAQLFNIDIKSVYYKKAFLLVDYGYFIGNCDYESYLFAKFNNKFIVSEFYKRGYTEKRCNARSVRKTVLIALTPLVRNGQTNIGICEFIMHYCADFTKIKCRKMIEECVFRTVFEK